MKIDARKIIIILAIIFVGFIVWAIVYALTPRAHLTFYLAPEQGTITIDGSKQSVKNEQKQDISPGKHTIVFSRSEFDSFSQEISIDNGQLLDIVAVLKPQTDAARELIQTPGSRAVIERYTSKVQAQYNEKITATYPIINILPIQARLYNVDVCVSQKYPGDKTKIALCANMYHEGLRPYIEKDILSRGFNPADYEIIYVDKYSQKTTQN